MSHTEYIKIVTASGIIDNTGTISVQGGFPTSPDEIVIKQITYDSVSIFPQVFMIQSSVDNQIVGAVRNVTGFHAEPIVRMQPRTPLPAILTFTILTTAGAPALANASLDFLCIVMEFIKYKKL